MCLCICACVCLCVCTCGACVRRVPTMWCDGLDRLGGDSYIPSGQGAVRVAAHKLLPLVVPGHRVDGLQHTHTPNTHTHAQTETHTHLPKHMQSGDRKKDNDSLLQLNTGVAVIILCVG